MVRIAACLGMAALLLAAPAGAGQSGASFRVGITILPPGAAAAERQRKPARLATHFVKRRSLARRYTWGAAAASLTRAGFRDIARQGQVGFVYLFTARRPGGSYRVAVSAASGDILKVWAL